MYVCCVSEPYGQCISSCILRLITTDNDDDDDNDDNDDDDNARL